MGHRVMGDVGQIITMRFSPDKYDTIIDICARSNLVINALGRDINKIFDNNMHYSNIFCTEQIAKACRDTAVDRLIHVSAMGASHTHASKYLQQKAQGEDIVRKYFPQATIVRPAPVYGTEDRFLNWMAKCLRILPGVPLIGGGKAKLQPVYCVDVGDAIANSVGLKQTEGKIVELAGPETVSWDELVDIVSNLVGEPPQRLPTPAIAAYAVGLFNEFTWKPGFTADFAKRMQYDIVESKDPEILKFSDIGVTPQRMETAAHEFLARWKRNPDYFLDVNYRK